MKKVLVVDDTKNIRILLTICLEADGYQVTSANNGKQALELLESEPFDLAFLDIKLPEFPGTEVLKRIREKGIQTPIIIMTAFATVKNAIECTKLGAVAYLQKPFTAEKVRRVLEEILLETSAENRDLNVFLAAAKKLIAESRVEEAYRQLKRALALDPGCGDTYELLAQVYEARGDNGHANRFKTMAYMLAETNPINRGANAEDKS